MIDIKDYFNPVNIESPVYSYLTGQSVFSHTITIHTENNPINEIGEYKIALIGVPENRNSPNSGAVNAPDAVRTQLYQLAKIPGKTKIVDLGNLKQGVSFNDTIAGLTDVLVLLMNENVFPIIIGGSSSVIHAIDKAFAFYKHKYYMAEIDSRIDYCHEKKEHNSFNYLNAIINNSKSFLAHYINIGYQTYLNDQQVINRFLKKKYDLVRLGDVRQALYLTEPLLRDSDAALFDISAVRQSDAPGTICPSPNGFYGEEICLLARYSGISNKLKLFGVFEIYPDLDIRNQTSALAAQIIWFFMEGFAQKQYENPGIEQNNSGRFTKYHVRVTGLEDDIIFIKSNLTDRWWMELSDVNGKIIHVACSYDDYLSANRNELPARWVKAMERIKS